MQPIPEQVWIHSLLCNLAGEDPGKHELNAALEEVFKVCKQHYLSNPSINGADFFDFVRK